MRPMLLGGTWVERDETIPVHDPDDGSLVDRAAKAGVDDARLAVEHATAAGAHPLPAHERAAILERVAAALRAEAGQAAELIAREGIKTINEALLEAGRAADTISLSAEEAGRPAGSTLGLDRTPAGAGRFGLEIPRPRGVIVGITPFNDPLNLVAHKVGPAIAGGNAIIIKPDSKTPLSALRLARLFHEAGLPPGWLQVLPGDGSVVGDALITHPGVAMVSLTGGVAAGRAVAARAGLKKISMELGANNAVIVADDADLEQAVPRLGSGMYWAAGQNCLHVQRILVHEAVMTDLTDGLVRHAKSVTLGPKLDPATDMGPLIDRGAQERVESVVTEAIDDGATPLVGASATVSGYEPTILADVSHRSRAWTDEIYGPVTVIEAYGDLDDAIASANDTSYGLAGAVFTSSTDTAFRVASRLEVGGVVVNDSTDYRDDGMPFGGSGDSGVGREGVRAAVREMTEPKTVVFTGVDRIGLG